MSADGDAEGKSFEECLAELEELVKRLEGGGLGLDESLEVYRQAVALRDRCRRVLAESERKVRMLMETADGAEERDLVLSGRRPTAPGRAPRPIPRTS